MLESRTAVTVAELSDAEWAPRLAAAAPSLPFGRLPWIRWGLAESPGMQFVPLQVSWGDDGDLLVPLCLSPRASQLGCFGYGSVVPAENWRGDRLPDFDTLAGQVCAATGRDTLSTLLPPVGAVAALEAGIGHWPTRPGRPTFLLDLADGPTPVWERARGSARTAVRRAGALGLRPAAPETTDGPALLELHRETLRRNGADCAYAADDIEFLVVDGGESVVVVLVRDGAELAAASVFAVGAGCAFHILQLTSAEGRRTNAGHLAFWEAITLLAEGGTRRVDLGCAAGDGQQRFKQSWGALPAAARLVSWEAAR